MFRTIRVLLFFIYSPKRLTSTYTRNKHKPFLMFLGKRNFLTCNEVDKHLSDYKSQ